MKNGIASKAAEWTFQSAKEYGDPFTEIQLDAVFTDPEGNTLRVPCYWAGDAQWGVRYSSRIPGIHRLRTESTDPSLHGIEDEIEIAPYKGDNPLYQHGGIRVSENRRFLEHTNGWPFLWLADTWWMGLCNRLHWPDEFATLVADRVDKGFTVIQIIAGLYPDMPAFDPRGANEAGFPWEPDYTRINPAYFDMADRRINKLVESGLVPCIVGSWGYHLPWLGIDKMKQHWRNLVARWGAHPVIWCIAGEGAMPYYLSQNRDEEIAFQKRTITELARYIREIDPFHRPIAVHPTAFGREQVDDPSVLDFEMLQTGHSDRDSIPDTIDRVRASRAAQPTMPTINSEVCYEGILDTCHDDVQRFMVWSCLLSGAAGHTYGANGIWQLNRREQPYGNSPGGNCWGNTPWDEAMHLPGSRQTGLARRLLERFAWCDFDPQPEGAVYVDPSDDPYMIPYCAGISSGVRVIYLPIARRVNVMGLAVAVGYRASWFDPTTGEDHAIAPFESDGDWTSPAPPTPDHDWVLVIER